MRRAVWLLLGLFMVAGSTAAWARLPSAGHADHDAGTLSGRLHRLRARTQHEAEHASALARKVARLQHQARVWREQLQARDRRIARLRQELAATAGSGHGGGSRPHGGRTD